MLLFRRASKILLAIASRLPLLGTRFWRAGAKAHKKAAREFAYTTVFSTIPIWLGTIVIASMNSKEFDLHEIGNALYTLLETGDLFLYCTSVLASVIWLNNKYTSHEDDPEKENEESGDIEGLRKNLNLPDPAGDSKFIRIHKSTYPPNKLLLISLSLIGLLIAAAFYALNLAGINISSSFLRQFSICLYIFSLVLYHNVLVSDHASFEHVEEVLDRETKSFLKGYAAHRRGNQ